MIQQKLKVRGQQLRRKQTNKEAGWKKEQGHLFVPSCAAKSLTEAIVNDIGESLQSEELRGAEEGGGKKSRQMRRFLFLVERKKVRLRASMVEKSQRSV